MNNWKCCLSAKWHLEPCHTLYWRFLLYWSPWYQRFLQYWIDSLWIRLWYWIISSFNIKDDKRLQYWRFSYIEDKPSISGSDMEVIWYKSGVIWYWYMNYLILRITFCILGPILKIPDIEDLNLCYPCTGNGYIEPDIEDLQYQRFLHYIDSV